MTTQQNCGSCRWAEWDEEYEEDYNFGTCTFVVSDELLKQLPTSRRCQVSIVPTDGESCPCYESVVTTMPSTKPKNVLGVALTKCFFCGESSDILINTRLTAENADLRRQLAERDERIAGAVRMVNHLQSFWSSPILLIDLEEVLQHLTSAPATQGEPNG